MKLSLVLPCFNEEKVILKKFNRNYQFIKKKVSSFEIILVDDGSKDKTKEILEHLSNKYPEVSFISYFPDKGKGYALKQGVAKAKGEIIGFTDADFAISLKDLAQVLEMLSKSADIVIGNRKTVQSKLGNRPDPIRRSISFLHSKVNNFFLDLDPIQDILCGFKFFKKKIAKDLFSDLKIYRWFFDLDILIKARRRKLEIHQIPVVSEEIRRDQVRILPTIATSLEEHFLIYIKFFNLRIFGVLLFLLLFIILLPFLLNPINLTQRNGDYSELVWPDYFFVKEIFTKYHYLPLWNPTVFSGIPEISNPQSPLIYPPNYLMFLMPIDLAIVILIFVHLYISGIFLYKIGTQQLKLSNLATLVLSFGIIFSPFYWSKISVGHLSMVFAMLLVSPILFFSLRLFNRFNFKDIFWLGLFFALQYLNYPTIWYYTVLFGGLVFVYLSLIRRAFKPFLSITLGLIGCLILIMPVLINQLKTGPLITRSQLTLSDLAIPIWSIKRFAISLGVPSNFIKDNEVEVWLYSSLLLVIAAFLGFFKLSTKLKRVAFLVILMTVLITLGNRTPVFSFLTHILPGFSYLRVSTRVFFIFVITVSFLAAWYIQVSRNRKTTLLGFLILVDLVLFSTLRIWFVPDVMKTGTDKAIVSLLSMANTDRYYCTSRCLSAKETIPLGINTADGYHLIILNSYRLALSQAGGFPPPKYTGNIPSFDDFLAQPNAQALGRFNIKWVVSKNDLEDKNFVLIKKAEDYNLYQNLAVLPRIRFENNKAQVKVLSLNTDKISLETDGLTDKLIVADPFHPSWNVYIDGKKGPIEIYQGWARAVNVPEGPHKIEFIFEPFKL
jgi:dolichyl-phosphate beta-glucosyltransferase